VAARAAGTAAFFLFLNRGSDDLGRGGRLRGAARFFLGLEARFLCGGFLCLAVLVGAAALVLALHRADALFTAAGFLEGGEARFLRLTQQLLLKFLASGDVVLRGRLARGSRRGGLRRRLGRFGDRRGLRRLGRRFAGPAENAALLDLDNDRIRAAVAEALFDLAGLDRALETQRRPGSKLRFFGLVCHSFPSFSLLQPSQSSRRVRHL